MWPTTSERNAPASDDRALTQTTTPDSTGMACHGQHGEHGEMEPGWKHWGMMLLCCLPMIAFVVLLFLGILK